MSQCINSYYKIKKIKFINYLTLLLYKDNIPVGSKHGSSFSTFSSDFS